MKRFDVTLTSIVGVSLGVSVGIVSSSSNLFELLVIRVTQQTRSSWCQIVDCFLFLGRHETFLILKKTFSLNDENNFEMKNNFGWYFVLPKQLSCGITGFRGYVSAPHLLPAATIRRTFSLPLLRFLTFEMFRNPCISKKRLTVIAFLGDGNGRGLSLFQFCFYSILHNAYSLVVVGLVRLRVRALRRARARSIQIRIS